MNEHIWWYLSRSTGIVALVLLVLSLVWGVLLSTRALRGVDRPAWLLATHTWLSGTAIAMTAAHLLGLVLDGWVSFGVADLLVPGAATWQGATRTAEIGTAVGVVSMYLLVVIQVTSLLRRRLSRRFWLIVHRISFPLVLAALVHAGWTGTDTSNRVYQAGAITLAMAAAVATVIRVITPSRARRAANA
ncbi:MAG: ferric reductase-like transmembrane domain-containing protein [Actinomycetota bacterium]|jgi:predicted ferric reductase|nr:ferric reductase-like transmembrane domain-containing protein [Actinomycetota bacterium]MDA3015829.1 ferric reductase-like transmembrane domain-containing protein [Actinomycetota bacterium]MDA3027156.1 ferric reductase-like transmembrane domain-containing protein [Actinomycetota bacterium]